MLEELFVFTEDNVSFTFVSNVSFAVTCGMYCFFSLLSSKAVKCKAHQTGSQEYWALTSALLLTSQGALGL